MANAFSREEVVLFEKIGTAMNDGLVMARNVAKFAVDQTRAERAGDITWRPMPYILPSFNGADTTANFGSRTQLSVPATVGYHKNVPFTMTATEWRDALQSDRLQKGGVVRLASDVNASVMSVAALQGTLVVKRTGAASGFPDVAACDAIMNETGVPMDRRYLALSTRDYNGLADDISKASRSFGNSKSDKAYEQGYVGPASSFDTYKLDISRRLAAAAGGAGITIDTQAAAANYYVPKATTTGATGETSNVDNRYDTLTVSSTANVAAGDCFTIAGVESCHHITKESSGQLKTFRVISVTDGTHMVVSPPIISNQGASIAEQQYQNCIVTASANAAIVFLNTVAAAVNPFWHEDAIEIIPSTLDVPTDSGAKVMRIPTDLGLELVFQKFYDIDTMITKIRLDVRWGVVMGNPEMAGIVLFSQT